MAKALLDATICITMDMDQMLQIGFQLHTYFRVKAVKQRRLEASLYPLLIGELSHGGMLWSFWSASAGASGQDPKIPVSLP